MCACLAGQAARISMSALTDVRNIQYAVRIWWAAVEGVAQHVGKKLVSLAKLWARAAPEGGTLRHDATGSFACMDGFM